MWGVAVNKHLADVELESTKQVCEEFDPNRHIYLVRLADRTNVGGERFRGRIYRVDLSSVQCTCMTP